LKRMKKTQRGNWRGKGFFLALLLFLTASGFPQMVFPTWDRTMGGSAQDTVRWLEVLPDGSMIAAGFSESRRDFLENAYTGEEFVALKLDATGNLQWQKSFGGYRDDRAYVIKRTRDAEYLMAGSSISVGGDKSNSLGLWDAWIVKMGASGKLEWEKSFGGNDNDSIRDIVQTYDGGYVFVGFTHSKEIEGHHGQKDWLVGKIDFRGDLQWMKAFGGSGYDMAYSVVETKDKNLVITGYTFSRNGDLEGHDVQGNGDFWILKLSQNADILWSKTYGGSGWDEPRCIRQTSDQGFILTGVTGSPDGDVKQNNGGWDIWLVKLDRNGNLQWEKTFGGSSHEKAFSVIENHRREFLLAGYTASSDGDVSENHGGMDVWVLKVSRLGRLVWEKTFGTKENECAEIIVQMKNYSYTVAAGVFDGTPEIAGDDGRRYKDFWFFNFNAN
ncbi:MAG TPA: hypothetical protein P5560_13995, partial [Thermotogota bacterium]|nr:hypothetical protein [Thermotogota bacterium]